HRQAVPAGGVDRVVEALARPGVVGGERRLDAPIDARRALAGCDGARPVVLQVDAAVVLDAVLRLAEARALAGGADEFVLLARQLQQRDPAPAIAIGGRTPVGFRQAVLA